jgi:membrane protease YdiL (CAAX protease family)
VAGPVFAAFVEEILFRGVLQTAFLRVTKPVIAIGLVAIFSTLAHAANAEFESQWLFYLVLAAFLGFVTFTTRSLLPAMILHGSMNFVGNLVFLFVGPWNSSTLPWLWQGLLLAGVLLFFGTAFVFGRSQRRPMS